MIKNLFKISVMYHRIAKLLCNSTHKVQKITENDMLDFPYDKEFIKLVLKKYQHPLINKMLKYGDLRLGLLLRRLEKETGLFDLWMEQYSKKYSPLGYYRDFEEPMELEFGKVIDNIADKIKSS